MHFFSYLIAEEKTWITHETWIDEEETTRQSLLVNNSDLYNLKSETQKYEDEWQRKGQERCIQKRLLIASALGLEDVVERLVHSGADPCFKQNKFGFRYVMGVNINFSKRKDRRFSWSVSLF